MDARERAYVAKHPRLSSGKDVDGRDKPGHDDPASAEFSAAITGSGAPGRTTGTRRRS
jgi:hypothetical protein